LARGAVTAQDRRKPPKPCADRPERLIFISMRIEKVSSAVFTPLENGSGVLLNLETLLYYSLNRTGVAVWKLLDEKSSIDLEDIAKSICQRFEVTEDAAEIDLRAFVEHLARFKMVKID
jgi:hypothetical protein